uniref:Uncharacterized protein n=1 Tax=Rousettus aegyptiacus TaxID=9407 RepID=A0A7J8BSM8_ROUAE|nr:hypothetical protein HJG63_009514 [Rousettus aegyptiacus]
MPFPQFLSPGAGPLPWAGAWSSSLTDSREQEPPRRGPTDQMGICSPRAPRAFRAPDSSRPETAEAGEAAGRGLNQSCTWRPVSVTSLPCHQTRRPDERQKMELTSRF